MTSRKRRRHTPDQIIRKLAEGHKQLAAGKELDEVCRHLEIAESTWHRWLAQYGGMKASDAKRLSGVGVHVGAMCPIRPNVLWALDFQFDTLADGRTFKMLNVIDEFTRECLAIEVDRSIDADHVVAVLDRLAAERGGAPVYVRFDNGPEFVAHAVADWCRFNGTDSVFIDPGSARGRTPGSSRSTAASATSSSTAGSSTACSKPE